MLGIHGSILWKLEPNISAKNYGISKKKRSLFGSSRAFCSVIGQRFYEWAHDAFFTIVFSYVMCSIAYGWESLCLLVVPKRLLEKILCVDHVVYSIVCLFAYWSTETDCNQVWHLDNQTIAVFKSFNKTLTHKQNTYSSSTVRIYKNIYIHIYLLVS